MISDCEGTQFNNVTIYDCGSNSIQTQRSRVMFSGSTYYTDSYVPKSYDDEVYYYYGEDGTLYEGNGEEVFYGYALEPEEALPDTEPEGDV